MKINHLTFINDFAIRGLTKIYRAALAPVSLAIFLYPTTGDENPNIPNKGQRILDIALVESPTYSNFRWLTRISSKFMTNLSETYGVYVKLRQLLSKIIQEDYTADNDDAQDAVCTAINSLESAMAYIPAKETSDRKIKVEILKKLITEEAEDGDGNLDPDRLSPRAKEQLALTLQLIKE